MSTGHKIQLKGYRTNKAGKLIRKPAHLSASAAIAKAKNPPKRYKRGK